LVGSPIVMTAMVLGDKAAYHDRLETNREH